ncbi:hypothetical protein AeRB84_000035 [Aphanomyces euteiches]|nr:hypothetical protein AeRB84_000035 [Aphanomyces euteiches]
MKARGTDGGPGNVPVDATASFRTPCTSRAGKRKRSLASTTPSTFLKRPQHLEVDLRQTKRNLEQAERSYIDAKDRLDREAASYRLAYTTMAMQSSIASKFIENKAKFKRMACINAANEAAKSQTNELRSFKTKTTRHTERHKAPPFSNIPSTHHSSSNKQPPPACADPYFYLRPLYLKSMSKYSKEQLIGMLLSPRDLEKLHRDADQWLSRMLDATAPSKSPDKHMDMTQGALNAHYLALTAHFLGSHAYASEQLAAFFNQRITPILHRIVASSIPSSYAALSKPLYQLSGNTASRYTKLIKDTQLVCPEVLAEVAANRHSASPDFQLNESNYVKDEDEAKFLQQCMWMRLLIQHAKPHLHTATNGIKAIARSIIDIYRRQMLYKWHKVVEENKGVWVALESNLQPTMNLRLALSPFIRASEEAIADPTADRSMWLHKYMQSFTLSNAIQHRLDQTSLSHLYRCGERLQLGHLVLLDEDVNPEGAQWAIEELHSAQQELAKYDRNLAWHLHATNLLADPSSVVFAPLNDKFVQIKKPDMSTPSPSLDTIQSRLQELASQLQNSQHEAASKWIGLAIQQLSTEAPVHSPKPSTRSMQEEDVIDLTLDDQNEANDDLDEDMGNSPPLFELNNRAPHIERDEKGKTTPAHQSPPKQPYLSCSEADQSVVEELGAQYDRKAKQWFVPEGYKLSPFSRWMSPQVAGESSAPKPRSPPQASAAPSISTANMYLDCPYIERNHAKSLGAEWDAEKKCWFVPPGLDLNLFKRWAPRAPQVSSERMYLDCPIPQNFLVRGLGAQWDPDTKEWFVPPGLDLARFTRWSPHPKVEPPAPEPTPPPRQPVVDKPQPRKIAPLPAKRRADSAIASSCRQLLMDVIGQIERRQGCHKCKFEYVWVCHRCHLCRRHCSCFAEDAAEATQEDLRSAQEYMFEAARRRARLLKPTVHQHTGDYTSCVSGSELVSTARILAMWRDGNTFGVLGVPPSASLAVIKRQYRTLVLQLHPDKSKHETSDRVSAFMAVTNAYRQVKAQLRP